MSESKKKVQPVSKEERQKIFSAFTATFGARLRPGESLGVEVERTDEHGLVSLTLETTDETLKVEIEAAVLADDDHPEEPSPEDRFEKAVEFVGAMFAEFLDDREAMRLHDDWRVYEFGDVMVRFRGRLRKPGLESLADAWLESGGAPFEEE